MNKSTAVFLINTDVRAIYATYESHEGAKKEIFKTFDDRIAVGDLVVVETDTRHKMTVVKVTDVDVDIDMDTSELVRWIVSKVDVDLYNKILQQEQEALKKIQAAELRQKREKLREAMFANHLDEIKALPLANISGVKELPEFSPETPKDI